MRWSEILRRALGGESVPPFRAQHSTPHQFERFDSSRIGSGEGAQMYGHGLYFAENPAVAQAYRESTARTNWMLDGQDWGSLYPSRQLTPDEQAIARRMEEGNVDLDNVIQGLTSRRLRATRAVEQAQGLDGESGLEQLLAAEDWARHLDHMLETAAGLRARGLSQNVAQNTYEVNAHFDPRRVLNFDAPIDQQSAVVRQVAQDLGVPFNSNGEALLQQALELRIGNINDYSSPAAYSVVSRRHRPAVSDEMRNRGLEAWIYNDQGSRQLPNTGTFNMVVPPGNEDRIEILRRWGLLGTLGGGSAYEALGGEQ